MGSAYPFWMVSWHATVLLGHILLHVTEITTPLLKDGRRWFSFTSLIEFIENMRNICFSK
jgi:hypothetical protein